MHSRFDLKSRKPIAEEEKLCLADLGFYYTFNPDRRINDGPIEENTAFLYDAGSKE